MEKKACQVVPEDERNAVSAAKKSGAEPAIMVKPRKLNTQWRLISEPMALATGVGENDFR